MFVFLLFLFWFIIVCNFIIFILILCVCFCIICRNVLKKETLPIVENILKLSETTKVTKYYSDVPDTKEIYEKYLPPDVKIMKYMKEVAKVPGKRPTILHFVTAVGKSTLKWILDDMGGQQIKLYENDEILKMMPIITGTDGKTLMLPDSVYRKEGLDEDYINQVSHEWATNLGHMQFSYNFIVHGADGKQISWKQTDESPQKSKDMIIDGASSSEPDGPKVSSDNEIDDTPIERNLLEFAVCRYNVINEENYSKYLSRDYGVEPNGMFFEKKLPFGIRVGLQQEPEVSKLPEGMSYGNGHLKLAQELEPEYEFKSLIAAYFKRTQKLSKKANLLLKWIQQQFRYLNETDKKTGVPRCWLYGEDKFAPIPKHLQGKYEIFETNQTNVITANDAMKSLNHSSNKPLKKPKKGKNSGSSSSSSSSRRRKMKYKNEQEVQKEVDKEVKDVMPPAPSFWSNYALKDHVLSLEKVEEELHKPPPIKKSRGRGRQKSKDNHDSEKKRKFFQKIADTIPEWKLDEACICLFFCLIALLFCFFWTSPFNNFLFFFLTTRFSNILFFFGPLVSVIFGFFWTIRVSNFFFDHSVQ